MYSLVQIAPVAARIVVAALGDEDWLRTTLCRQARYTLHPASQAGAITALGDEALARELAITAHTSYGRHAALTLLVDRYRDRPGTVDLVVDRAHYDPDVFVRLVAVRLLHHLSEEYPDAARALREIAETDPEEIIRNAAGERAEPQEPIEEAADPKSLRAAASSDASREVRVAAVRRLADADPGAGDLLGELVRTADDWPVRDAALVALAARYHDDPETLAFFHEVEDLGHAGAAQREPHRTRGVVKEAASVVSCE